MDETVDTDCPEACSADLEVEGLRDPAGPRPSGFRSRDRSDGRVPPHDLDAERICIDHALRTGSLAGLEGLEADHFWSPAHATIWRSVQALAAEGLPVGYPMLGSRLRELGRLAEVGGVGYLAEISDAPATVRPEAHVDVVLRKAELRRLVAVCQRFAVEGYTATDAAFLRAELVAQAGATVAPERNAGPSLPWVTGGALAEPVPEHPWAVRGLQLGPGRPGMVVAYAGTAKTLAMQSCGLAYAAGRNVWGQFPVNRGGVFCHLDYEQGSRATRRRYQRLAFAMGVDLAELGDRLRVVSFPKLYLNQTGAEAALEREVDGAGLVVIDSLRAAMPGVDENDSAVRSHVDMLTRISERCGATFVLIHHAGKQKEGGRDKREAGRGSSALMDAVGCCYLLTMTSYGEPRGICQTKLPAESDGTQFEDAFLALEDVPGPSGSHHGLRVVYQTAGQAAPAETPSEALRAAEDRIRAVLRDEAGASLRKLRALVGGGRTMFDAALEGLLEGGELHRSKAEGSRGGGGDRYYLHAEGEAEGEAVG